MTEEFLRRLLRSGSVKTKNYTYRVHSDTCEDYGVEKKVYVICKIYPGREVYHGAYYAHNLAPCKYYTESKLLFS